MKLCSEPNIQIVLPTNGGALLFTHEMKTCLILADAVY